MSETEERMVAEHMNHHLTDGFWHDSCPYCLERRRHGGNGLQRRTCGVCEVRPHLHPAPAGDSGGERGCGERIQGGRCTMPAGHGGPHGQVGFR